MKKSVMVILIILALAVALGVYLIMHSTIKKNIPTPPTVSGNKIELKSFAFNPSELKIKTGETVTWTNKDSAPHTVTSDSGTEISSPTLSNSQTYSHTFNAQGTFQYHCSLHPGMKAKIIVE